MNQRIVFGSPEARAILQKDKELQRMEEEDAEDDSNKLADRLEEINNEIEDLEIELAGLEDEAADIREKLRVSERPDPKHGFTALNKWNSWATGTLVAQ